MLQLVTQLFQSATFKFVVSSLCASQSMAYVAWSRQSIRMWAMIAAATIGFTAPIALGKPPSNPSRLRTTSPPLSVGVSTVPTTSTSSAPTTTDAKSLRRESSKAYSAGNYLSALEFAEQAIRADGSALSHNSKGLVLEALDRFDEALAAYDTAIRLDPKVDGFYSNKAACYVAKGNLGAARSALLEALKLPVQTPNTFYQYGQLLAKEGKHREAIEQYVKAINLAREKGHTSGVYLFHEDYAISLEALGATTFAVEQRQIAANLK